MEVRRLRDKFCAEVQGAPAPAMNRARVTFGEMAAEWLAEQEARKNPGVMSPRTYENYELALRRHVLPTFASRQIRAISPDDLVSWIRNLRVGGYALHSVHNYWVRCTLS
jgi:Phage integrase, N-terminal SAM-like domain